MSRSLPVVNLAEARFECTFGRGCDGLCCRQGRPVIYPEEASLLDDHLTHFLPHLREPARTVVKQQGYLSRRMHLGLPTARVADGWCVFFNQGCVLHKLGAAEGDSNRYKPAACALFPLARDDQDRWYVRQKGYEGEKWELFCLDPNNSPMPASESLRTEVRLAAVYDEEDGRRQPASASA